MPGRTIYGTNSSEVIDNLDGVTYQDDTIFGYGGIDYIYAGGGNDWLKGGGGADQLFGGSGNNTADYGDSWMGVSVELGSVTGPGVTGRGHGGTAEGDLLFDIQNLTGSQYEDTFRGNSDANVLSGRGGTDWLWGFGGTDTLNGGSGDDHLIGGADADILNGDIGTDRVVYYGDRGVGVTVDLRTGVGFFADAEGDTLSEIENVTGSIYDDTLLGNGRPNELRGEGATDRLEGFGGDDLLDGGTGADTLVGGTENDRYIVDNPRDTITERSGEGVDTVLARASYTLTAGADVETLATFDDRGTAAIDLTGNASGNNVRGNDGRNVLNGGGGRDTLTGNGGNDWFRFDTAPSATNVDDIADLNVAGDDTIVLEDLIFGAFANGPLAEERFVTTAPLQDNDNIIYDADGTIYGAGSGALFYDRDGNGPADAIQFATLSPGTAVSHDDFLVL